MNIEDFLPKNFRQWERNILTYNHSILVAKVAKKIAKLCGLDAEMAFLCGKMHDIGKFIGIPGVDPQKFYQHPRIGYELLKNINMQVAKVCIAHSFILSSIKYDDYVELIQLCDKISGHDKYVSIEQKIEWYKSKGKISINDLEMYYKIPLLRIKAKFECKASELKEFEHKVSEHPGFEHEMSELKEFECKASEPKRFEHKVSAPKGRETNVPNPKGVDLYKIIGIE